MGEIGNFVNGMGKAKLPLVLLKNPAGSWSFAGTVPEALAYTGPADAIADGKKFGFGFVRHRGVKVVTFPTKDAALAAAAALGVTVDQVSG